MIKKFLRRTPKEIPKDGNYYPQVFLKERKYIGKEKKSD